MNIDRKKVKMPGLAVALFLTWPTVLVCIVPVDSQNASGRCELGQSVQTMQIEDLMHQEVPQRGNASVWYLGHCGFAVRTSNHLLIFDYQESRDGQQPKSRPTKLSLENGWVNPEEIKDLAVGVFVSHSHNDHFDPVILERKKSIPDIQYFFISLAGKQPTTLRFIISSVRELNTSPASWRLRPSTLITQAFLKWPGWSRSMVWSSTTPSQRTA
jgi:hypothetical protein